MVKNTVSPEKVVQQPSTTPEPIPKPVKSNKAPVIIMTVITLLSLSLSGYLYYQNIQLKKQTTQVQPTPSPNATTPSPSTDSTANWTNYSNTVENFTFRYPQTWTINIADEMGDERKENVKLILTKGQAEIIIYANLVGIGGVGQTYDGEAFTLDGNSLYLYNKTYTNNNSQLLGITDSLTDSIGVFILNGKTYSITVSHPSSYSQTEAAGIEEEFKQILSTFKFTQ